VLGLNKCLRNRKYFAENAELIWFGFLISKLWEIIRIPHSQGGRLTMVLTVSSLIFTDVFNAKMSCAQAYDFPGKNYHYCNLRIYSSISAVSLSVALLRNQNDAIGYRPTVGLLHSVISSPLRTTLFNMYAVFHISHSFTLISTQ
jgi:hypothetical protein